MHSDEGITASTYNHFNRTCRYLHLIDDVQNTNKGDAARKNIWRNTAEMAYPFGTPMVLQCIEMDLRRASMLLHCSACPEKLSIQVKE